MKQAYFLNQLEEELVVALGCTEPVAVAYAAALAKQQAGIGEVRSIDLKASVNIYKNAIGVFIPGTQEMGAGIAAALLHRGGGEGRVSDDVADGVDVGMGRLGRWRAVWHGQFRG